MCIFAGGVGVYPVSQETGAAEQDRAVDGEGHARPSDEASRAGYAAGWWHGNGNGHGYGNGHGSWHGYGTRHGPGRAHGRQAAQARARTLSCGEGEPTRAAADGQCTAPTVFAAGTDAATSDEHQ